MSKHKRVDPAGILRQQFLIEKLPKIATAGLMLSILAVEQNALAQTPPEDTTVRLKYVHYQDFQAVRDNRMKIYTPMLWVQTPLSSSTEFEGSVVYDAVSGASPLYLDTLSGASGKGIDDTRYAGDFTVTQYFDGFSIGAGGAYSDEDDYLSRSGALQAKIWTEDKNTVFAFGISEDWDRVSSSNNPDLDNGKRVKGLFFGITQVLSPQAIIQSNIGGSFGHGYYTDPYKLFDNRPHSRDAIAWLTRFNYYFESLDAALHIDYRFFADSWDVKSHTIETSIYQPVSEILTLVPRVRYYYQQGSDFFNYDVPTDDLDRYITADMRLSDFGAISVGLKLIAQVTNKLEFDALYDYMQQSSEIGLQGNDNLYDIGAHYFELGMAVKF